MGNIADDLSFAGRNREPFKDGLTGFYAKMPFTHAALEALYTKRGPDPHDPIIYSERRSGMNAATVAQRFFHLYARLGFVGCSSHSGRRTFLTNCARKILLVGGSLRDVQMLAGHADLTTTSG
jgi:integrase/recombinase XerD